MTTLREERASIWEQMKAVSELASTEGRDLTSEEYTKYEALEADLDGKRKHIERLEREEGITSTLARSAVLPAAAAEALERAGEVKGVSAQRTASLMQNINRGVKPDDAVGELREVAQNVGYEALRNRITDRSASQDERWQARMLFVSTDEYRDAYVQFLRHGLAEFTALPDEVRAALNVGTGAQGGFTVPTEFLRQLIQSERFYGVMRDLATVITTDGSGAIQIPKVDDANRMTAAWTAEAAAFTESEDQFLQVTLGSFKEGAIVKLSDEIIHDSAFDVLGFVAQSAGQALGLLANTSYVTGASGSTTTPEGLFTKATVGFTMPTGNASSITSADYLFELYHSVRPAYRPRGSWMFSDTIIKQIRQLKASTSGVYIWQPSLAAGDPDTIVGRPVYADPDVAVPAANAKCGGFGSVADAYYIRDVQDVTVKILNELYAANGQVGYRIHRRTDGDIIDTLAFKTLVNSAT